MTHTYQGGLGMLVLTRKMGQSVDIDGGTVTVTVLQVNGSQVKLGLVAPADMAVHRAEVAVRIRDAGTEPVPIAKPKKRWRRTRLVPSANERLTQEAQRMHREDEAVASAEERREREQAASGGDT